MIMNCDILAKLLVYDFAIVDAFFSILQVWKYGSVLDISVCFALFYNVT